MNREKTPDNTDSSLQTPGGESDTGGGTPVTGTSPDDSQDNQGGDEPARILSPEEAKIERAKQLARIICICNGINLGRVLRGMDGCETVADINRKVGTGSGGCKGERCGPRLKTLLRKRKDNQSK